MPKILFYAGTAFCLFLALASATETMHELRGGALQFVTQPWGIVVGLVAGLGTAALFLRMAALLAARNLFGAFFALLSVGGAMVTLGGVLFMQWRLGSAGGGGASLGEVHFAAFMTLGFFVSLSLLSLRPYFSIQASRFLSATVFFPMPLFVLVLAQEMFVAASPAPLPATSQASSVYFAVLAILFFAIAVHCIRHRYLFLETTNLRELLDARVDPSPRPASAIGGVAFDS